MSGPDDGRVEVEPPPGDPIAQTALEEYRPTAAALAQLTHRFRGVVFDVTTTKGNEEARSARLELVRLRTALENRRKQLKAPALERSRLIDSEAARIRDAIVELEDPIDKQIKADEERRENERKVRAEAEQRRLAELQRRVSEIRAFAATRGTSEAIEAAIRELVALPVDASFAELEQTAALAKAETLGTLRELLDAQREREAEQARIDAERAELARLRAEAIAREAAERERVAQAQREEAERLAQARHEIEQREANLRREAEERAAAEREERRIANEAAAEERRRADAAAAAEREAADQAARAQREQAERELAARLADLREREEAARVEREQREAAERAERERVESEARAERERQDAAEFAAKEAEAARLAKLHDGAEELLAAADAAVAAIDRADLLIIPDELLDARLRLASAVAACR